MKRKRDANGKFVKMYPTREEYEAKIVAYELKIKFLEGVLSNVAWKAGYWKKEYLSYVEQYKGLSAYSNKQGRCIEWLVKRMGPFLRWRYFRALDKGLL